MALGKSESLPQPQKALDSKIIQFPRQLDISTLKSIFHKASLRNRISGDTYAEQFSVYTSVKIGHNIYGVELYWIAERANQLEIRMKGITITVDLKEKYSHLKHLQRARQNSSQHPHQRIYHISSVQSQ